MNEGMGEREVVVFSAKRWNRRNRADLIESASPCDDAQLMGSYRGSSPLHLTTLTSLSEDNTTAPQHLQSIFVDNIYEDSKDFSIVIPTELLRQSVFW